MSFARAIASSKETEGYDRKHGAEDLLAKEARAGRDVRDHRRSEKVSIGEGLPLGCGAPDEDASFLASDRLVHEFGDLIASAGAAQRSHLHPRNGAGADSKRSDRRPRAARGTRARSPRG